MKRYSEDELIKMSKVKMNGLFESGKMDDDDAQRWHDLRDEASYLADEFVRNELSV